jgi:hypothetical protein
MISDIKQSRGWMAFKPAKDFNLSSWNECMWKSVNVVELASLWTYLATKS